VGGPARFLACPASLAELQSLLAILAELGVKWLAIGRGSNLLVGDTGYDGVMVMLGRKFAQISRPGEANLVRAEAGCSLMRLGNWCAEQGLSGLEFATGIPGSVGGAVVMNAGAWGEEIGGVLDSALFVDRTGRLVEKARGELSFSYRHLAKDDLVVAAAQFILKSGEPMAIRAKGRELLKRRKARQPRGVASAGSFFKNPPDGLPAAGKLIEDAGLKGLCAGGAKVSEVHANFLVNTGGASAGDFLTLMDMVQDRVFARFAIRLEPEVRIIEE